MSKKSLDELKEEHVEIFVDSFDTVIVFCEGILSNHGKAIPDSQKAVDTLKKKFGKRILYFSRDVGSSRREIIENMRVAGCDLEIDEIVCSTFLMAKYLKKFLIDEKAFVIDSSGTCEEFDNVGLTYIGSGPEILTTDLATFVNSFEVDREVGAVVVGFDEHFSYPKMLRAASYLSNSKVVLMASSRRSKTASAMIACIETCSDKRAVVFEDTIGLIEQILIRDFQITPDRTIVIGPDNNKTFFLTGFDQLQRHLSIFKDDASFFDEEKKFNEKSNDLNFYAENLAEIVSRLKI